MKSINLLIACEPYKGGRGLKSKISSGVSIVQQKTEIIPLKVVVDAEIEKGRIIKAGSLLYIKEEILYTYKDQYTQPLDCKDIKEPFVLANYSHVAFVKEK